MTREGAKSKAYKLTENGIIIPGGTTPTIQNVSLAESGDWTAVQLPEKIHCKQILLKTRAAGTKFKLATVSEGTPAYVTLESVTIEMGGNPLTSLFYVKADTVTVILEIMSID